MDNKYHKEEKGFWERMIWTRWVYLRKLLLSEENNYKGVDHWNDFDKIFYMFTKKYRIFWDFLCYERTWNVSIEMTIFFNQSPSERMEEQSLPF